MECTESTNSGDSMAERIYLTSMDQGLQYLKFRPQPPNAMIDTILDFLGEKRRGTAVDVGCGSGQVTGLLSSYFKDVLAIDLDPKQMEYAKIALKHCSKIRYHVGGADIIPCEDSSVDLVIAVQSAHWFNLPVFYEEVKRVLSSSGVLAVAGYRLPNVITMSKKDLSSQIQKLFAGPFKEFLQEGSRLAYFDNYRTSQFETVPFSSSPAVRYDSFETDPKYTNLEELLGYVRSGSTYQECVKLHGPKKAEEALLSAFPGISREEQISITFSYFLLLSKKC